jgi:hypothetical protein
MGQKQDFLGRQVSVGPWVGGKLDWKVLLMKIFHGIRPECVSN